jgi:hypothetical protein
VRGERQGVKGEKEKADSEREKSILFHFADDVQFSILNIISEM